MKKIVLILTGSALVLICAYAFLHNSRLTVKNIIAVRPGMTMEQVKAILGEPIREDSLARHFYSCPCNAQRTCLSPYSFMFTYTKRGSGIYPYPMLWIHFNYRKRVSEVYVKKYWLFDDSAIYAAQESPCDSLDPILPLSNWESVQAGTELMFYFPLQ